MARDASTSDHLLGDADADPERPDDDRPRDDRFGLCYIVFLLAGAGTMFPWNVFITERAYFDVRLFAPPFTPALADSFESVFGVVYLLVHPDGRRAVDKRIPLAGLRDAEVAATQQAPAGRTHM